MSNGQNHLYKVGDFCYFEVSSSGPYQIRRIDELIKASAGHVEVRATAYCRKRDLPEKLQEKIAAYEKDSKEVPDVHLDGDPDELHDPEEPKTEKVDNGEEVVSEEQLMKHRLSHREVFLTRMVENLPASLIRGKCLVYLLAECEGKSVYLKEEDVYFYTHIWDPNTKTLGREKGGDIRVGSVFQAEVPAGPMENPEEGSKTEDVKSNGAEAKENDADADPITESVLQWSPGQMAETDVDNFLMIMRSVGTFGRALDCNAAVKQPSLHLTAAAASRDVTIATGLHILHRNAYQFSPCLRELVGEGPLICRDQMELWTAAEAGLFEEALEKYGKDFEEIRQDLLPWKTMSQIIEYYYMWKTSDRFVSNKRIKAAEADGRLNKIYIPPYIVDERMPTNEVFDGPQAKNCCEGCRTTKSANWFAWGGLGGFRNPDGFRLCNACWGYWKKYGDLKRPIKGDKKVMLQHGPGIPYSMHQKAAAAANAEHLHLSQERKSGYMLPPNQRSAQLRNFPNMAGHPGGSSRTYFRTRPAIYFIATSMMKQVRRVGEHIFKPRRAARRPFQWINSAPIKEHYQNADPATVQRNKKARERTRTLINAVADRLQESFAPGRGPLTTPAFLIKGGTVNQLHHLEKDKSRMPDGRIPSPPSKRVKLESGEMAYVPMRNKARNISGRLIWPDAPEDFYYHISPDLKKVRRQGVSNAELKKAGRGQYSVMNVCYDPARLQHFLTLVPARTTQEEPEG